MSLSNKELGKIGEKAACSFLEKEGLKLLAKNYRALRGEIDLIMSRGGEIIFIEVKTRSSDSYGYPLESITEVKKGHIFRTAQMFLRENNLEDAEFSFWAAAVYADKKKKYRKSRNN